MKKLVIIATGWHFPLHFYQRMVEQKVPDGWEVEYVCISHRNPIHSVDEKKQHLSKMRGVYQNNPTDLHTILYKLESDLYEQTATVEHIKKLGWQYTEEPNTIGDWGCANQWLEKNDVAYDVLLISHDDNYIIGDNVLEVALGGAANSGSLFRNDYVHRKAEHTDWEDDWLIISNSFIVGKPHLRGSFDFFKKEFIDMLGGKFDLSNVTLTRVGEVDNPTSHSAIGNWNRHVDFVRNLLMDNDLFKRVYYFSPTYRVSDYCIEGERGYISKMFALPEEYKSALLNLANTKLYNTRG